MPQRASFADIATVESTPQPPPGGRTSLADVAAIEPFPAQPAVDARSRFAQAVDVLSQPTAPGRWLEEKAKRLADLIEAPAVDRSVLEGQIRGALAGAVEGTGQVIGGFSSPLGLAATVSGVAAPREIGRAHV